jgi:hypothetical protein
MVAREVDLDITAGLDIVTAQTAEILGDHAPDLSGFDIVDHTLESGAVEIAAGIAVVNIEGIVKHAVLLGIRSEHSLLVADAHAFIVPAIFEGKAAVERRDER